MKQTSSISFRILVTLFSLFFARPSLTVEPCHINARVTEIPPLFFQDDSKKWTGLTVDLTKVLLKEANCTVEFESINWARSLELMKSGKIDMMMNMSITEEREKYIHFIGPHNNETIQLLLRDSVNTNIRSLEDFKKIPGSIGYQPKTYFGKAFNEKLKNDAEFAMKFEKTSSQKSSIEKLKLGRIVGILKQNYSGVSAEKDLIQTGDYKINPFIINTDWVYFGFSKKAVSTANLQRIEKAFERVKRKKGFQKVIDRYK